MDLITLTLSKNHLWSALSVAGLAGVTYLTNRYVKNTTLATNQTYYKPFETLQNYNSRQLFRHLRRQYFSFYLNQL